MTDTTRHRQEPRPTRRLPKHSAMRLASRSPSGARRRDPNKGAFGQDLQIGSQSVPGGSVTYAGQATVEQRATAATQLSELAFDVLTNAGLGTRAPRYL